MKTLAKFLDWWCTPLVQVFVFVFFLYCGFRDLADQKFGWVILDAFVLFSSYSLIVGAKKKAP